MHAGWQTCLGVQPCNSLQIHKQVGRQAGRRVDRQAGWETGRQTDRQAGKQVGRQAGRREDRQAGRQTDRQEGRNHWLAGDILRQLMTVMYSEENDVNSQPLHWQCSISW